MCYRLILLLNPLAGALWITPAALALILSMLLLPRGAAAEESSAQPALPDQVIREVTEQVMQVVSEADGTIFLQSFLVVHLFLACLQINVKTCRWILIPLKS